MTDQTIQDVLYLIGAWERGAYAEEYPNEIEALRQALAQPEQEPVAWLWLQNGQPVNATVLKPQIDEQYWKERGFTNKPLYAAPPSKPWVSLTSEELASIVVDHAGYPTRQLAAIEAALRSKNNG